MKFYAFVVGLFAGLCIYKAIIWRQNPKYFFTLWKRDIKALPGKIRCRIWNKYILLMWYKLWIRKDEFHKSLDMDSATMLEMNKKERDKYITDLVRRREIAHQRGMAKTL